MKKTLATDTHSPIEVGFDQNRVLDSDRVLQFYNENPYPPPVKSLDGTRKAWSDRSRRRVDYHLFWPEQPYREEMNILVAGCGTSQAAQYAVRFPDARVVGIDLSPASLRYTEKFQRKYKLDNLTVHQLAVEDVQELSQRFDKIVCTGVLHHLPDPNVGLQALRAVLAPGGAMHLMVYASYGRTGIYMIQEYARRLGVGTSNAEIDELVEVLRELPDGHPLRFLLQTAPDFRRRAALADALLNPLDRAYTVPELYDYLACNGMKFGRWLRQAPYLPQVGVLASTPHAKRLASMPAADQHAAVELFRGTMVRHSAIAYRDDHDGNQPTFAEDGRWLNYVPLRLPNTTCVEERLPPGAAAVLINQRHTFQDIYLPINGWEKRLYEAIDGKRVIQELLKATDRGQPHEQRARSFFERLWQYDQAVFDITQS